MEVGEWLRKVGLGRYESAFIENAIGFDVLAELTDDDLAKLGMVLGDRTRCSKARAEESLGAGTASEAKQPPSEHSALGGAERRHLTVMICDLVGSTALASRLDPEEMGAVMDAYHAACARIVQAYDGFLG